MASFTNNQDDAQARHRSYYDSHDASEAANSSGSLMRQIERREITEGHLSCT